MGSEGKLSTGKERSGGPLDWLESRSAYKVTNSLMNPKLLPVYLLFVCQFQLFAEATANETVILWSTASPSGTYPFAHPKTISTSRDNDRGAPNGNPTTALRHEILHT